MDGVKGFFASKTVWGGIVALIASGLSIGHWTISPDDQKTIVELITGIPGVLASLTAIYGRVMASKQIQIGG